MVEVMVVYKRNLLCLISFSVLKLVWTVTPLCAAKLIYFDIVDRFHWVHICVITFNSPLPHTNYI